MTNEHPSNAWPACWTNVKERIVLDLGCGFFGLTPDIVLGKFSWGPWGKPEPIPGMITTTEHFLKQGAKQVIGVDANQIDIDCLIAKFADEIKAGRAQFFCWAMISAAQIARTIQEYKIEIVKSDIEGAEHLILDMDEAVFSSVQEFYVEAHSHQIEADFMATFRRLGYKIRGIIDQGGSRPVIFASREEPQ